MFVNKAKIDAVTQGGRGRGDYKIIVYKHAGVLQKPPRNMEIGAISAADLAQPFLAEAGQVQREAQPFVSMQSPSLRTQQLRQQAARRKFRLRDIDASALADGFSPAVLRRIFRAFDVNHDERITHRELQDGLLARTSLRCQWGFF